MGDNDREVTLTHERVCEIAFQAAGAASVPFMREPPFPVMPTEEISAGVAEVLASFGIHVENIDGYRRSIERETPDDNDLFGKDPKAWAERFVQRVRENPQIATDEGAMLAWFSGAFASEQMRSQAEPETQASSPPAESLAE